MRQYGLAAIGLAILIGLLYGSSLDNSWFFDDYQNILRNPNVHLASLSWEEIAKSFQGVDHVSMRRPVSYLSFALNHYVGQLDVFGYHLVNITIHYLTALFLFLFLYETLNLHMVKRDSGTDTSYGVALLATVLWAVNPVQVTAVTYIVQRMTSLCTLFYVVALFFYIQMRVAVSLRKSVLTGGLCLAAGLLSLGSKENGAMLPASLFLLEFLIIQGATRRNLKEIVITAVLSLVVLLAVASLYISPAAILDGYQSRPFTLGERLLTQPRIIIFYISLLLYPIPDRLTLLHDIPISTSLFQPWTTLPAILCVTAIVVIGLGLAKKRPLISFSILFFFVNHLIEGTFIPLELIFEHRNYLPSMLFFLPISIGFARLFRKFVGKPAWRAALVATLALVLLTQGMTVIARNHILKDVLSLWSDNVEKSPRLDRPHRYLGIIHLSQGRLADGRNELYKALDAPEVSLTYNKTHTLYYLGQYYRMIGEDDKALEYFRKSLEIAASNPQPLHGIAEILLRKNDLANAETYIGQALGLKPEEGTYHLTYSAILIRKGWPDAAIAEAKRGIRYQGELVYAYLLLADAYTLKNDPPSATHYKKLAKAELEERHKEQEQKRLQCDMH